MATLGGLVSMDVITKRCQLLLENWEDYGFGLWVAHTIADGRFTGRGGLRRCFIGGRDEIEVSYAFIPEFWGLGLATELAAESVRVGFEVLKLPELVCFTLPTNTSSRHVMEKVGFRYEKDVEWAEMPHVLYRLRNAKEPRTQ
jgi:[ribosomal protein S5]-alanine N-acetyltransferase